MIEEYLRKEKTHKHLIFVLNKVDLVPTWVTQRWVAVLSQEVGDFILCCDLLVIFMHMFQVPTIAFHASLNHPFGKGALINLFRQLAKVHCLFSSTSSANLAKLEILIMTAVFRFTRLPSRYLLGSLGIQTQVHIFCVKLFTKIPFKRGFICRKELGDQCPQI